MTGPYAHFAELLGSARNILVLTHDNPDPDTFAAGMAILRLAAVIVPRARVTLGYDGIIGRVENQAMVTLLRVPLVPYRELRRRRFDLTILVDTQFGSGNNPLRERPSKLMVFDHHPPRRFREYDFSHLDEAAAATALLLVPYLDHFGIPLDRSLATALVYALRTETLDLQRDCNRMTEEVYVRCFRLASKKMLGRIEHARHPPVYFQTLRYALGHTSRFSTVLVTRCDEAPNPEFIPEVCELLLRCEGVRWVLAVGRYQGTLYLSIRTTSTRRSAGRVMKALVHGVGSGGGHVQTAGGKIVLDPAIPEHYSTIRDQLCQRFLGLLGKSGERGVAFVDEAESKPA
ncbi:MAG: hypothetical protein A2284_15010 [Deltaproteobacteria bacterium RIFOXYA12_FULL_61_11]|nr:MAG: hypothetical protein A2284_15010 [Deltaproteobacteria bacterium RIFOXYA12_FULL_61_11]